MNVIALLLPADIQAQWEPISPDDWIKRGQDNSPGFGAEVLFEKIDVDDRKLDKNRSFMTIYHRIRIHNNNGRHAGDVVLPFFMKGEKVEEIKGHTILPDGRKISLDKEAIRKKEITRKNRVKYTQHSFSLPGITDDCIIEYYIKYRLPRSPFSWLIQKPVPLRYGQLRWRFFRKSYRIMFGSSWLMAYYPNHTWLYFNDPNKLHVDVLPSQENPKEIVFSIRDVPAFIEEPQTLPDITLRSQLRFYYSDGSQPLSFWENASREMSLSLRNFYIKDKQVRKIIDTFDDPVTVQEQITTAYMWCQTQLRHIKDGDIDTKQYKKSKHADEVLKRGYGTTEEINLVFYTMLRVMGINAVLAYVVDRNEDLFIPHVKFARFAAPLVAIRESKDYRFYSPGHPYLLPGSVPPFHENISAFLVGIRLPDRLVHIPPSTAVHNRTHRMFNLQLTDANYADGTFTETRLGHSARDIRVTLAESGEGARLSLLKQEVDRTMIDARVDAVTPSGIDNPAEPLILRGRISEANMVQTAGSRVIIQPFGFLSSSPNPFPSDIRRYALMFEYAYELVDMIRLEIPDEWTLESIPEDTVFTNEAGLCEANIEIEGNTVTAHRRFVLTKPYWPIDQYAAIQKLFLMRQTLDGLSVVLKRQ